MRQYRGAIFLALVAGVFVAGLTVLFRLRVAKGDLFPVYSSLRADPLGLRGWHDALELVPGVTVTRHLHEMERLKAYPARTIVIAGVSPREWEHLPREAFEALDAAVATGSRLVVLFKTEFAPNDHDPKTMPAEKTAKDEKAKDGKAAPARADFVDWREAWNVKTGTRGGWGSDRDAEWEDGAPADFPAALRWRSSMVFSPAPELKARVLYRRLDRPVLVEFSRGRGSVVLASDTYFASNEALQADAPAAVLAWLVGPNRQVEFEEGHLGMTAEPGIAALARHYGLGGAAVMAALLAVLVVWRRMAPFVPAPVAVDDVKLSYRPTAGLETLLHRAVAPGALLDTCVAEWERGARESERTRAEAARVDAEASPVGHYNAITRALRRR